MNWTLLGITIAIIGSAAIAIFLWAVIKIGADADRQMEAYLRKNPPSERDPFDRPHGEL